MAWSGDCSDYGEYDGDSGSDDLPDEELIIELRENQNSIKEAQRLIHKEIKSIRHELQGILRRHVKDHPVRLAISPHHNLALRSSKGSETKYSRQTASEIASSHGDSDAGYQTLTDHGSNARYVGSDDSYIVPSSSSSEYHEVLDDHPHRNIDGQQSGTPTDGFRAARLPSRWSGGDSSSEYNTRPAEKITRRYSRQEPRSQLRYNGKSNIYRITDSKEINAPQEPSNLSSERLYSVTAVHSNNNNTRHVGIGNLTRTQSAYTIGSLPSREPTPNDTPSTTSGGRMNTALGTEKRKLLRPILRTNSNVMVERSSSVVSTDSDSPRRYQSNSYSKKQSSEGQSKGLPRPTEGSYDVHATNHRDSSASISRSEPKPLQGNISNMPKLPREQST